MDFKPIGGKLWRTGEGRDDIDEMEEIKGALEAMLFVADDPLAPRRLADVLDCDEGLVVSALQELRDEYASYNRGMQLREVGGGWRMHTHPAYASQIEKLLLSSRRARLTRAAVETLAIIAYMQPITRGQVANLRGVQSESMVKVLEEQGLVAEAGKERSPGGPVLYATTEKFLERFGLNSLDELPPLEDFEPGRETVERIAQSLSGQPRESGGEEDAEADMEDGASYDVAEAVVLQAPAAVPTDAAEEERRDRPAGEEEVPGAAAD
ncbi:MAG: SMC-Scp complex subunit ScpB [Actinomycetota bacterium]